MTEQWTVSAFVWTGDQSAVARAGEVLGRAVAGLALEGIDATLSISQDSDEEAA